ncbi:membrane protease YdiL (CAAX protease family) [Saonia flava]|uniref:Membrane protease YdiL (CAAX protease family) n=1 Tax=Saonia flava TaxID=523696 RepID=A0A846QYB3_9FLAO|nr:CPBP family intramembrane glutamic endopeptidase [Saonia flava]NJB72918.1 membrane protease YdiL (CAAX protease family) [Saonia flava]
MNKKIYLILLLFLTILLAGYYFTTEIKSFWINHLAGLGVMLFSGLTIVGLNKKKLPIKEKAEFKLNQIPAITAGIIGLLGFNNFIQVLGTKVAGIEMEVLIKSAGFNKYLVTLIIFTVFEEIVFRRILAQFIKNKIGIVKGIWISALIFSVGHIYSDTGLLYAFFGGLVFAYIYFKTKNIYLSIWAHLFYNLLTYFLTPIFADNINSLYEYPIILTIIIISITLIYGMVWQLRKPEKQQLV